MTKPEVELNAATRLAVERTRLAHERTLMAWVRTATSLISFGFTLYKFFQYLQESQKASTGAGILGPRGFALSMIGIGLAALALATIAHRRDMKSLRTEYGSFVSYSIATVVASLIAVLGIAMLLAVVFQL